MPPVTIPELKIPNDFKDITNQLIEIYDYLGWLLKHLDSLNVQELTANHISAGTIDVDLGINIESGTGGVYIDSTGLEIHNGNFRMYDDGGLTAIIDGGTFYGDNFVVTHDIRVGGDIYMNFDYLTTQPRYIYFDRNNPTAYYILLDTGFVGGPRLNFIDFAEVYINSQLTTALINATEIYENGARVATQDWVTANFVQK